MGNSPWAGHWEQMRLLLGRAHTRTRAQVVLCWTSRGVLVCFTKPRYLSLVRGAHVQESIASEWGPTRQPRLRESARARGRGGIPFFVRKSKPVAGDAATSRHATPRARRESAGAARRHARERRPCRAPLDRHG